MSVLLEGLATTIPVRSCFWRQKNFSHTFVVCVCFRQNIPAYIGAYHSCTGLYFHCSIDTWIYLYLNVRLLVVRTYVYEPGSIYVFCDSKKAFEQVVKTKREPTYVCSSWGGKWILLFILVIRNYRRITLILFSSDGYDYNKNGCDYFNRLIKPICTSAIVDFIEKCQK